MKRMIAAGRLGKKSGQGFYDYRSPVSRPLPTDEALRLLEIGVTGELASVAHGSLTASPPTA
jgi:3-hydroxyacyl-CoA dehydrogenase